MFKYFLLCAIKAANQRPHLEFFLILMAAYPAFCVCVCVCVCVAAAAEPATDHISLHVYELQLTHHVQQTSLEAFEFLPCAHEEREHHARLSFAKGS